MKTFKKIVYFTIVVAVVMTALYYGEDIKNQFIRVEYKTVEQKEVVVTDEFAQLVKEFSESSEGQEVLNTWATQKALEVQRKKLDEIEKQTLKKEASL